MLGSFYCITFAIVQPTSDYIILKLNLTVKTFFLIALFLHIIIHLFMMFLNGSNLGAYLFIIFNGLLGIPCGFMFLIIIVWCNLFSTQSQKPIRAGIYVASGGFGIIFGYALGSIFAGISEKINLGWFLDFRVCLLIISILQSNTFWFPLIFFSRKYTLDQRHRFFVLISRSIHCNIHNICMIYPVYLHSVILFYKWGLYFL